MDLQIYRGSSVNLTTTIDEKTKLNQRFFGENNIRAELEFRSVPDIAIGDYIVWEGVKYYINTLPDVTKIASNSYKYIVTFESEYYEIAKVQFLNSGVSEFYLIGILEDFIDLVITNLDRIYGNGVWTRGTCNQSNAEYKLLSFNAENCMEVLERLCTEFEGEVFFNRKVIKFTDTTGVQSGLTFKYRYGLRGFTRQTVSNKNIVTRLYGFGSKKNINTDYRSGAERLLFENGGVNYLEKNVATYGTIEHSVVFEDIYPHRDGTVTSVGDEFTFYDTGMNFDLNDYLISGVTAKVHFQTGNLAGYTFELYTYTHGTTKFVLLPNTDNRDLTLPNDGAAWKPAEDDKYVLLDIKLPQAYIDTAETALQAATQIYLNENSDPHVVYNLTPDPRYFKTNAIELHIGDYITIEDTDLDITFLTRIIQLTRSLSKPYQYSLQVSDYNEIQVIQRQYNEINIANNKIKVSDVGDIARSRSNWRTVQELQNMVFDTDGYFTEHIKPLSIETALLSVGSKSRQFTLSGVTLEPNYTNDEAKFHATAGSLVHFAIAETVQTWIIYANDETGLTDGTAYYIYARCHKSEYDNVNNQIVLDADAKLVDADATYYYFLVGVLHSVVSGIRGISTTYGHTLIDGGYIKTGTLDANVVTVTNLDADNITAGTITLARVSDSRTLAALSAVAVGNCDTTIISGGKIITGLLTATNIQAGTLTGRTVQTAASGQRIVLDQSDNTLKMYNADDIVVVKIDDATSPWSVPTVFVMDPTNPTTDFAYMGKDEVVMRLDNAAGVTGLTIVGDNAGCGAIQIWNAIAGIETFGVDTDGYVNIRPVAAQNNALLVHATDGSTVAQILKDGQILSTTEVVAQNLLRLYGATGEVKAYTVGTSTYQSLIFNAADFSFKASNVEKVTISAAGDLDAVKYLVNGAAGANFNGEVTNITVVDGLVTAAS